MPSQEVQNLQAKFESLKTQTDRATTVQAGAVVLLNGLGDLLRANADNPAAINAIADGLSNEGTEMDMSTNELVNAMTAHTPTAPTPLPEIPPEA